MPSPQTSVHILYSVRVLYTVRGPGPQSSFYTNRFRNERRLGTRNLKNDSFRGHLQPPIDKNSNHISAILILEFDDVTVKTICSSRSL